MKILLVGNYINDKQESMQRFANVLYNGLKNKGHNVKLIRPEPFFGRIIKSGNGIGKWLGYIDKFLIFPNKLKKEVKLVNVVHICDHSNSFYVKYIKNKNHVITCCDLLAIKSALNEIPQNKTKFTGKILQKKILNGLKKSQKIVCISENTKKDLLRLTKKESQVVYMGLNYNYIISKNNLQYKKYFIHIGNNSWYKNRIGVLKIFNELKNCKLIMVGKPFTKEMKQFIHKKKLDVIEKNNISNKELNDLYSNAAALIFPSLQEGFGWPIIEAQSSGCPVFTTNKAPMTEVGGNAAVYFDNPENHKECAKIIEKNLNNLNKMKEKGLKNARKFSTENMIGSYIEIYNKIK